MQVINDDSTKYGIEKLVHNDVYPTFDEATENDKTVYNISNPDDIHFSVAAGNNKFVVSWLKDGKLKVLVMSKNGFLTSTPDSNIATHELSSVDPGHMYSAHLSINS